MRSTPVSLDEPYVQLVNGSAGDPVLFVDYPGKNDAFLFDCGDLSRLDRKRVGDVQAVFLTHHHIDHVNAFDVVLRANLDSDKTVSIFGPDGTIDRLHRRITSYVLADFSFMKLVFEVHELRPGEIASARLECTKKFELPEIRISKWKGPVVFETSDWKVEAAFGDHTAPCVAYSLMEKPGYQVDASRWTQGLLRPGPWIDEALRRLRAEEPGASTMEIQGGVFSLDSLKSQYFRVSKGARVAFITDTEWNEKTQPALTKLAHRARSLYCDSYYSIAQLKNAKQHKHMTATHAAELASKAKVEELVLMHFAPRYSGKYLSLVEEAKTIFANTTARLDSDERVPTTATQL